MISSEFFPTGSRLHRAARRTELSQQRASAAASRAFNADKFMIDTASADLKPFMSVAQLSVVRQAAHGEEKVWFITRMVEIAALIHAMPETYAQDGMGDQAVAHLHYFKGSCDWWITGKDSDPVNDAGGHDGQIQAFGLADLGYGGELGYISIAELIAAGVELDLHFKPCTLASLKADQQIAA